MFSEILRFELKYWFKNPAFYVYAFFFFFLGFGSAAAWAGVFGSDVSDANVANSPVGIFKDLAFFSKLLLFLLPAIIGNSIYKDFKSNVHSILYAYPFSKLQYLSGKFFSGFLVVVAIVLFLLTGMILGVHNPLTDTTRVLAFNPQVYTHLFGVYLIPNLLFFGVIVFGVVALSRNIYAGFITLVLLFLLREIFWLVGSAGSGNLLGLMLDPLGETPTQYLLRNWTIAEKEINPIPFDSTILFNRLFWLTLAGVGSALLYRWFSFNQQAITFGRKKKEEEKTFSNKKIAIAIPKTNFNFSFFQRIKTAWKLSGLEFRHIWKSGSFISILIAGAGLLWVMLSGMNEQQISDLIPVTWVVLSLPMMFFSIMIMALTFLYAGVLIHRPRTTRFSHIIDATPVSNWTLLLSKFFALLKMQTVLLLLIIVVGVAVQISNGYTRFEFGHYFTDLFGIHLIGFVIWAFAALMIQTLFTNIYLGLFLLLIGTVAIGQLPAFGIDSLLFQFNENPDPGFYMKYSDMHGHGHALRPYFLYKTYWLIFGFVLFGISLLFWQRELTSNFKERLKYARTRFKGSLAYGIGASFICFVGLGIFIFQQSQLPFNQIPYGKAQKQMLTQFQNNFKKYENTPQPRITSVFVEMDIFPERESFEARGKYSLVNKTNQPIDTLLIKSGYDEITEISFDKAVEKIASDDNFNFEMYKLSIPIPSRDSINLNFSIKNKPNTLLTRNSNVLTNGTMINSDVLPRLGYFASTEKLLPNDSSALSNSYQSIDSDDVFFETIVSTSSDQTAVAPGYLQKEWEESNRRYFHYKLDRPVKFAFQFNSGRFEMQQEEFKGTDLRIYHHPTHTYCLPQFMDGLKSALDYNTTWFSPYQHRQAQIIEFPRTEGSFATTSANCIPTSELRFINDVNKIEDGNVDISFYVAAHELSHQWWGGQVIPANTLGAVMVTESMAEYITAKIYEKKYGKQRASDFLKKQRQRYLLGRTKEENEEPPLIHVATAQSYISYGKGAISLYTLSEYIGEENLNNALKSYLEATQYRTKPYTTSVEMLSYLKDVTPDSLQYLIEDIFETVTFYNKRLNEAKVSQNPDGKYQVDIDFEIHKTRADSTKVALADYIEIGIFGKGNDTLHLQKHKIVNQQNELSIIVNELPEKVGIDPYFRLMDRNIKDDWKDID